MPKAAVVSLNVIISVIINIIVVITTPCAGYGAPAGRPAQLVTIVDLKTNERTQIPWSQIKPALDDPGEIFFEWNRGGHPVQHSLWTDKEWDGRFAYEILARMAAGGALTIYLRRPGIYQDEFARVYRFADVELGTEDLLIYPMPDVLSRYKREQEIEHGRYFGFAAGVRRITREWPRRWSEGRVNLRLGWWPRRCEVLFFSVP